jgi:hypothetical protein
MSRHIASNPSKALQQAVDGNRMRSLIFIGVVDFAIILIIIFVSDVVVVPFLGRLFGQLLMCNVNCFTFLEREKSVKKKRLTLSY